MSEGTVIEINIAPEEAAPTQPVDRITVEVGHGVVGDRHYAPNGLAEPGHALTLIAEEAIAEANTEDPALQMTGALSRRQVLTRGIGLNELVGKRFRVGDVLCEGVELCEPCTHLQAVVGRPLLRPLVHRAGLNAAVLEGGEIAVGAIIAPC
jgi:MOSC domain-containing protein YiiM